MIHGTLLVAVHMQPDDVVTVTVPEPPLNPWPREAGEIEYVQAACVTVTVCPATVKEPLRWPPVFGAVVTVTDCGPEPAPGETLSHGAPGLTAAVQGQPLAVPIDNACAPPSTVALTEEGTM